MKKQKSKYKKLSIRLLLIFVGITVGIVAVFTTVSVIAKYLNEEIWANSVYVAGLVMLILVLAAFVFITNKLVVRRIENLNKAVSDIAKGNFDLTVSVSGNDELAELSENFNKMTAELQANAFLSKDFARYVSHEFKTPLSVIRSYAEAVQINNADKETNDYMEIIISETDRLAEMSKTIMELCRLDSTTLVEKKDVFSPAAQIRSILLSSQIKWNEKNIEIEPNLDEFEITGNENLMFRIWQNLISNAIKFTNDGGNITITLKKQTDAFLFAATDNGIGIADEDKDKIFNMFFTGDKSHNKEGSGLGLPLTKNIVEKLGGEITFMSERGKGTTFTVRLPL